MGGLVAVSVQVQSRAVPEGLVVLDLAYCSAGLEQLGNQKDLQLVCWDDDLASRQYLLNASEMDLLGLPSKERGQGEVYHEHVPSPEAMVKNILNQDLEVDAQDKRKACSQMVIYCALVINSYRCFISLDASCYYLVRLSHLLIYYYLFNSTL